MNSEASVRLFRRRTETEVFDGQGNRSRSGRKLSMRGNRRFASLPMPMRLRSLSLMSREGSKFSTFSPDGGSEALEGVTESAVTGPSLRSPSTATVESSSVSSTVIDIYATVASLSVEDVKRNDDDDGREEYGGCDDFFSRLLGLIRCFPRKREESPEGGADAPDVVGHVTGIECILEQPKEGECEGADRMDPVPSPLNDVSCLSTPPPLEWVQEPLLLVATPGRSDMKIRRIRRVSDPSYFESPAPLQSETVQTFFGQDGCCHNPPIQLPINNGREPLSQSHVIDFETNVFAGTALFRIRGSKDWALAKPMSPAKNGSTSMTSHDYFAKYNRKFQMVLRGRFKADVVMADCVSGLLLDQHLATFRTESANCADGLPHQPDTPSTVDANKIKKSGRSKRRKGSNADESLPPKWALRAAVKVAGVFSPRMDADLESPHPRMLSPLCSAAQTVHVSRKRGGEGAGVRLDENHAEPHPHDEASLVNDLHMSPTKKTGSGGTNYAQRRKHAFDAAYDTRVQSLASSPGQVDASPCFDPEAEYTFEFLQHLIDYNDLSMNLGKLLGKVRLGRAFGAQPIRFVSGVVKQRSSTKASPMSMDDLVCIWSFDLWHKSLVT